MDGSLAGKRVLVVEDEYFIADDLGQALAREGAEVVGPVPNEEEALKLVGAQRLDLAVIDINLEGEPRFRLADALAGAGVRFVFATGYDAQMLPERHAGVPRWEKPYSVDALVQALAEEAGGVGPASHG